MSRFVTATSIGLGLAIALAFGVVGWRLATFAPPAPESRLADPQSGYAFYAALNRLLAGADTSTLDTAVTSDFVDHRHGASADELAAQLFTFGQAFPGTQLRVQGIEASAAGLVVLVAPIAPVPVPIAGATLSTQPIAGGYEVLHLRNGKVSERWAPELPAFSATSFPEAGFAVGSGGNLAMRLERVRLPGGSELSWQPGRTSVLLMETGAARLRLAWSEQREARNETVEVHAGEPLLILSNRKVRIERMGADVAQMLVFSMSRVTAIDVGGPTVSGDASSLLLWTSNLPLLQTGERSVAFGRMLLPERADVMLHSTEGMGVLLCSEIPVTLVVTEGGSIESLDADLANIDRTNATALDAGGAAHVQDAGSIGIRTSSDTAGPVWIIAVFPEKSPPMTTP